MDYTCFVTKENGRALLKVAVTPAGTPAAVAGDPLIVRAAVDETASPAAVGVPNGATSLPARAKAANAGNVRAVAFACDGNVVYARKAPTGTVLVVR